MKKSKVLPALNTSPRLSNRSSVPEQVKNILIDSQGLISIGMTPISELEIKWKDQEDYEEIRYILQDILEFPSTDIAELHRDSNRLGTYDIFETQQQLQKMLIQDGEPEVYCQCCGFLLQSNEIPIETSMKKVGNIGVSTRLYFQTIIATSLLLTVLFIVYGVFALTTNIIAYNNFQEEMIATKDNFLIISLSAKQLHHQVQQNSRFYLIQCWLGLAVVILWIGMFTAIKYMEQNDEILIDSQTISAADFTVVIEGVPTNITKQALQNQFNQYYSQLSEEDKPKQIDRPFVISKINSAVPFYLTINEFMTSELKKTIEEKLKLRECFIAWIMERKSKDYFSASKQERLKCYNKFRVLEQQISLLYQHCVARKIDEMKSNQTTNPTTSVYVTFESTHSKQLLLYLNSGASKTINRYVGFCCEDSSYFNIKFEDQIFRTSIKNAPEPEDIVWTNIGQSFKQKVCRKLLTYSITVIILAGSFTIFFFLSSEQKRNNDDAFLSFIISLPITVINMIIKKVIRVLTEFEREPTQTNFQTDLAIKSTIAQIINSILLPFIVKYYIHNNIYKVDGLAYVVFTMGISNSFLEPAFKVLNIGHIIYKIKCWYYGRTYSKLSLTQQQLNSINTLAVFETGSQYIFSVNLFLFICFYVSLQPIICLLGIASMALVYWAQKFSLFKLSKRPFPGNGLVNRAMYRILYFGPFAFSMGNLTWSNILDGGPASALIPNLISIGISIIFMAIPYKGFFNLLIKQKYEKNKLFSQNRIYLTSEYDRLNPATAKQALLEYEKFLRQFKQHISNSSKQEKAIVQQLLLAQKQKGKLDTSPVLSLVSLFDISQEQQDVKKEESTIKNKPDVPQREQIQQENEESEYENHIAIKQDGIEELRVRKRKKKQNIVNAKSLFQQFFIDSNLVNFGQNWSDQPDQNSHNKFLSQLINTNLGQIQEHPRGSDAETESHGKIGNKIGNQLDKNKKQQQAQKVNNVISYGMIKNLFSKHQNDQRKKQKLSKRNGGIKQQNQHQSSATKFLQLANHEKQKNATKKKPAQKLPPINKHS